MCPVAADTPTHEERIKLLDALHGLHLTMTLLALKPSGDVPAVIEDHVIWKIVDLDPFDWSILRQRRYYLLNLRRVLKSLSVTVHTRARCGYARNLRLIRRRVTVQALNLVISSVNFV